jgi:hypothetical protein
MSVFIVQGMGGLLQSLQARETFARSYADAWPPRREPARDPRTVNGEASTEVADAKQPERFLVGTAWIKLLQQTVEH